MAVSGVQRSDRPSALALATELFTGPELREELFARWGVHAPTAAFVALIPDHERVLAQILRPEIWARPLSPTVWGALQAIDHPRAVARTLDSGLAAGARPSAILHRLAWLRLSPSVATHKSFHTLDDTRRRRLLDVVAAAPRRVQHEIALAIAAPDLVAHTRGAVRRRHVFTPTWRFIRRALTARSLDPAGVPFDPPTSWSVEDLETPTPLAETSGSFTRLAWARRARAMRSSDPARAEILARLGASPEPAVVHALAFSHGPGDPVPPTAFAADRSAEAYAGAFEVPLERSGLDPEELTDLGVLALVRWQARHASALADELGACLEHASLPRLLSMLRPLAHAAWTHPEVRRALVRLDPARRSDAAQRFLWVLHQELSPHPQVSWKRTTPADASAGWVGRIARGAGIVRLPGFEASFPLPVQCTLELRDGRFHGGFAELERGQSSWLGSAHLLEVGALRVPIKVDCVYHARIAEIRPRTEDDARPLLG